MKVKLSAVKKHFLEYRSLYVVVIAVLLLMGCVAATYWGNFPYRLSNSQEVWGQFGDYFGGVLNPILSFAAFIILITSFRQQISDGKGNSENHEELLDNHRFFELVSLTHEAARGVEVECQPGNKNDRPYRSHRAISHAWDALDESMPTDLDFSIDLYNGIKTKYREWRLLNWRYVGSYFESVLFVLRYYVIEYEGSEKEKTYFLLAMRAQMSMPERNILFYEMLDSEYWHAYVHVLQKENFWRGGADKRSAHRQQFIDQSINEFASKL